MLVIVAVRPVLTVRGMCYRRHYALDFRHGNRRQESTEQQEQGKEYAKASKEHQSVVHGWPKVAPRTRQKVTAERGDRNHETFEPHADVYKNANDNHPKG